MKSERMHLRMPIGATAEEWARALECGRWFGTDATDKPAGPRHGIVYGLEGFYVIGCWWTATRAITVEYRRSS